ncbi:MAG: (d)CMP kinase [Candidatus Bipolaricaulota bacterium]|nr:(d)CMP kinase [Candidatus Bipolaricaulota bacterium]MBS3791211.1 (d)CMP kinase [Candidatus Bipolaricaulota bacterium]
MKVTIDGPAGVGKTSVGRQVARRFSLLFIQSGQLYRALAYGRINGLQLDSLSLEPGDKTDPELLMDGEKLKEELTTEEIGEKASKLAKEEEIRELVNEIIIDTAADRDVLVEGRDIGTAVLTNAEVKIYLTASAEERARRRKKQMNTDRSLGEIEAGIKKRDKRDQTRELAPLKPADDSVIIDTSSLSEREVVDRISKIITKRKTREK